LATHFDEWIVVNHPKLKRPAALVALRDTRFVGYVPLWDPRDSDGDGQLSTSEWAASHLPIVGALTREAEIANVMEFIAMDPRVLDVGLKQQGEVHMLGAALVAVQEGISLVYISKIAGPLAGSLLSATHLTGATYYVAKKGLEAVIKAMIERAVFPR
jgi:hypothetical protein